MPFKLIKGTFHVVGYEPDGDSIRFQADHRENWALLDGPPVVLNAREHAQLRIEAIDTLETHYHGHHQPLELALAALEFLLDELDIKNVESSETGTRVLAAEDGTRGHILTRKVERFGRPVCFVFAGDIDKADGDPVYLNPDDLENSVNYRLAQAGLAYPTYYTGLFWDLRQKMTSALAQARENGGKGIWAEDKTIQGFVVANLDAVTDQEVILPKLFRRIIDYMGNGGSIDGFKQYLEANPDPVMVLESCHFTHLDTYVKVTGQQVRLEIEPEKLVFVEK